MIIIASASTSCSITHNLAIGRERNNMGILTVLVFILGLASAFGSGCKDISGKWENELGSRMSLQVRDGNRLTGEYCTAVEANEGASRISSNVSGIFSYRKKESLLAFSVLFNHGESLTSWVGQCIMCDGKEILYTTYVLRAYPTDPKEKWSTLVINRDTFWRTDEDCPTKSFSENFYMQSMPYSAVSDDGSLGGMLINEKWKSDNEEIYIEKIFESIPGKEVHVGGKWKTNTSEESQIYGMVDRFPRDENALLDVHGRGNENTILAVALVGKMNGRVRGWTGYISPEFSSACDKLETSWLEHEFSPSCSDPQAIVLFGMENYKKVTSDKEYRMKEPETFLEKIRRFFTSMF